MHPVRGPTVRQAVRVGVSAISRDGHGEDERSIHLHDPDTMVEACLAGLGIAQVLAFAVADHLVAGTLVGLFPDWLCETFPPYAVRPSRRLPPDQSRGLCCVLRGDRKASNLRAMMQAGVNRCR
ncbi:LysR substrate-binding domain-containing protein [Rhizobium sp. BK650]|uniref:LysR substrate-binding domain-containing protein n=1 Tax=Rhizobium sp. BK650 TaxID=2586990 RepID=UPI0039181331